MKNLRQVYDVAENVMTTAVCTALLAFGAYMTVTPQMMGAWLEQAAGYLPTVVYTFFVLVIVAVAIFGVWAYKRFDGLSSVQTVLSNYDFEFVDGPERKTTA